MGMDGAIHVLAVSKSEGRRKGKQSAAGLASRRRGESMDQLGRDMWDLLVTIFRIRETATMIKVHARAKPMALFMI